MWESLVYDSEIKQRVSIGEVPCTLYCFIDCTPQMVYGCKLLNYAETTMLFSDRYA